MSLHNPLEDKAYTSIVHTSTPMSLDLAGKLARAAKDEVLTKAEFYAKKDGKCFKVVVEGRYRNRSSEISRSRIVSETEVTLADYNTATSGFLQTERW